MQSKAIENIGYLVNAMTILVYFGLLFVLETPSALVFLRYLGLILFGSGIILIILAILALRRDQTGTVINSGAFAVVRHPMYLGSILLFISMSCFLPHWIMVALSVINLFIIYRFMLEGERQNLEKFRDAYARYMEVVPRANLFTGVIRLLQRKRRGR